MAARSSTEPAALRESVRRMPSNGATNTWLTFEDAGHEGVAFPGVEQEQDDPRPDDELDQPEDEDDDPPGHLGAAGTASGDAPAVGPHRLLARGVPGRGRRGYLGDDRPVDLVDGHGFLRVPYRHPGEAGGPASCGMPVPSVSPS